MKKVIFFLIILSLLIIQCSNESSIGNESENEKSQTDTEFIDEEQDYFVYENETETNTVKTIEKSLPTVKENKKDEVKTENKINENKTNEVKTSNESEDIKVNENTETEIDKSNETLNETINNNIEKIVYISKTGKKYHLENCRTLRGEKEAVDLNEATQNGYEACKICNPDSI